MDVLTVYLIMEYINEDYKILNYSSHTSPNITVVI
jgi:hypothetical protein